MRITSLPILFSKLNGTTDRAVWDPPDMSKCLRTVDFDDLENITVTVGKLSIWVFNWVLFVREDKSTLKSTTLMASVPRQLSRHCEHD